jgi:endonuclease-3
MPSKKKPSRPQETPDQRIARAGKVLRALLREFPSAKTALTNENPFQLLVATILSAQCTDERVNKVTPALFRKYPTPAHFAALNQPELETEIHSTGFFRMKAKSIIGCSRALMERFNGAVPARMEELVSLPGVGRKTANVVLGQSFGIASGIVVDTHVHRLAQRLGFSTEKTPEKIEQDLVTVFPKRDWIDVGSVFILHGRKTCNARKPRCGECTVRDLCPSADILLSPTK